jgi:hypothetical protein
MQFFLFPSLTPGDNGCGSFLKQKSLFENTQELMRGQVKSMD